MPRSLPGSATERNSSSASLSVAPANASLSIALNSAAPKHLLLSRSYLSKSSLILTTFGLRNPPKRTFPKPWSTTRSKSASISHLVSELSMSSNSSRNFNSVNALLLSIHIVTVKEHLRAQHVALAELHKGDAAAGIRVNGPVDLLHVSVVQAGVLSSEQRLHLRLAEAPVAGSAELGGDLEQLQHVVLEELGEGHLPVPVKVRVLVDRQGLLASDRAVEPPKHPQHLLPARRPRGPGVGLVEEALHPEHLRGQELLHGDLAAVVAVNRRVEGARLRLRDRGVELVEHADKVPRRQHGLRAIGAGEAPEDLLALRNPVVRVNAPGRAHVAAEGPVGVEARRDV
eukprot:CAMPEP_0175718618 /NCGR_PEP_ID=MMETSP0097-20121207/44263_1 /TAXON_ID=311494 /ORGANISM="Alexandrium monilatum, Strain CCMP3105" /LENGTH=342 /DNA_ID=CAMNT_0017026219 /DNA_START=154 /DNA_END=1179 /DNA_ORIENTATION=+